jgi:hypothetical protein
MNIGNDLLALIGSVLGVLLFWALLPLWLAGTVLVAIGFGSGTITRQRFRAARGAPIQMTPVPSPA